MNNTHTEPSVIKTYCSSKTFILTSSKGGKGLFASENILTDEKIAIYINHSCDPDIGMDGQICFVAMRDIQEGEELCLDYSMAITNNYNMKCNCGNSNCRKVITGDNWKKEELHIRYGKYFSWFIYKNIYSL